MGVIVVGVDGSEASQEALRYALRQAKLEGDRVRAVTAWHVPAVAYGGPGVSPLTDVAPWPWARTEGLVPRVPMFSRLRVEKSRAEVPMAGGGANA
jgi:nucleotide-binding universal stress UspA family protein